MTRRVSYRTWQDIKQELLQREAEVEPEERKTSVTVYAVGASRKKLEEDAIRIARQFFGGEAGVLEILPYNANVNSEGGDNTPNTKKFGASITVQLQ